MSKDGDITLFDRFALCLVVVGVVLAVWASIMGVQEIHEANAIRDACEAAGGIFVTQRFETPLCLASVELLN